MSFFVYHSLSNWNLEMFIFWERENRSARRKKNLSKQSREPTTNSTHIWPHWWEESALIMYHSSLACEQAPHLGDIVESRRARGTRQEERKKKKRERGRERNVPFFKRKFFVLEALWIDSSFSLKSNDLFLDRTSLRKFGSNSCYIHFDALQCIFNGFNCGTLLPIQEKSNGIASYLVSELWQGGRTTLISIHTCERINLYIAEQNIIIKKNNAQSY